MSTTAPEYLTSLRDGMSDAVRQWMDQSTTAWDQWARAWTSTEGMASWLPSAGASAPTAPWVPGRGQGTGARSPGHRHGHDHGHGGRERPGDGCGCGERGRGEWRRDARSGCRCGGSTSGCGCGCSTTGCGCAGSTVGCGCADPCRCCVPDADVIVHARIGEVRVVPFRLRNPWRRERPVTLEVGPWHGCDGDGLTVRAVLEEESIVLRPCEDRVVRLLVAVRPAATDGSTDHPDPKTADATATDATGKADDGQPTDTQPTDARAQAARAARLTAVRGDGQGRDIGDVEGCATAYADVRFEGCARPQRVALVVLPAGCDAVDVACGCGCCCQEGRTHE